MTNGIQIINNVSNNIIINNNITIRTPIFLLGYDLDVQWKDEEYHSGNILCGVVNGSAIKLLSQLPSISGSINNRQLTINNK